MLDQRVVSTDLASLRRRVLGLENYQAYTPYVMTIEDYANMQYASLSDRQFLRMDRFQEDIWRFEYDRRFLLRPMTGR